MSCFLLDSYFIVTLTVRFDTILAWELGHWSLITFEEIFIQFQGNWFCKKGWYACDFIFVTCDNMQKMITHDSVTVMIRTVQEGIWSECHGQNANVWNATDLCVWGFGVGVSIYCIGVLGNGILSRVHLTDIQYNQIERNIILSQKLWLWLC